MGEKRNIRIALILGSMRPGNMTGKALALVVDELRQMDGVEITVIDPAGLHLAPPGGRVNESEVEAMRESVRTATGLIVATPEYHGSYSSTIKLIIDNMGFPSMFAAKPVALLGVAAGTIGAIKAMEHLRSVISHTGGIVLPGSVSVASVNTVFDEDGNCLDEKIEKRIRGVAHNLMGYINDNVCPRMALEEMVRNQENQDSGC